jgi:hypothetical protein
MMYPMPSNKGAFWAAVAILAVTASARAQITAPEASQMQRVDELVIALGEATSPMSADVQAVLADPAASGWQTVAARRMDLLSRRADDLRARMAAATSSPPISLDDYRLLLGAYLGAAEYAAWLHSRPAVATNFQRVQQIMDELAALHGGYPEIGSADYLALVGQDPEIRQVTVIAGQPVQRQPDTTVVIQPPANTSVVVQQQPDSATVVVQQPETTIVQQQPDAAIVQSWEVRPVVEQLPRIQVLAQDVANLELLSKEIEKATDRMRKDAKASTKHAGLVVNEDLALQRIEALEKRADEFHKAVKKADGDLMATRPEYQSLVAAYVLAVEAYPWLGAHDVTIGPSFRSMQTMMDELVSYYGGYPQPGTQAFDEIALRLYPLR